MAKPFFFQILLVIKFTSWGDGYPFTEGFREKGFDTFPWLDKDRNTNCNEREAIQYNDIVWIDEWGGNTSNAFL